MTNAGTPPSACELRWPGTPSISERGEFGGSLVRREVLGHAAGALSHGRPVLV